MPIRWLRERALLSDAGMKAADVAAKYRVSGSWVRLLKQRRRDTGEVAPRVQRQGRRGMREPHLHTLAARLRRTRIARWLSCRTPSPARADGLARRAGPRPDRYKKRPSIGLTSRPRGSRGPRRRRPRPPRVSGRNRQHPQCFPGTAARASTTTPPAGAGTPAFPTLLAAVRVTGLTAPGVFDGAIDGESFRAYIDQTGADPAARRHRHWLGARSPASNARPPGPPSYGYRPRALGLTALPARLRVP